MVDLEYELFIGASRPDLAALSPAAEAGGGHCHRRCVPIAGDGQRVHSLPQAGDRRRLDLVD